ncbi:MAG: alpha-L-rhamnosidase-related protein [Pirellulaceae bacterium]
MKRITAHCLVLLGLVLPGLILPGLILPAVLLTVLASFSRTCAWTEEIPLRIGFVDGSLPSDPAAGNAAALDFAATQGAVVRLRPMKEGGWQEAAGRWTAPEESDVVWFHQADDSAAAMLPQAATADLYEYLELGGVLLVSGAAGRLVNDLGIEPTTVRVLGPTSAPYRSGINVVEKHRQHPVFAGLDTSQLILLTSSGGNALADFYDTAGPHGELLAEGNAGLGERPLVEYELGAGRVIFVGWRLPDFTTKTDTCRPNLERLFGNLLHYLAQRNTNRGRLVRPEVPCRYVRVLGVPLLRTTEPAKLAFGPQVESGWMAVALSTQESPGDFSADDVRVSERPVGGEGVPLESLGLTVLSRPQPVAQYVALRQTQQASDDRQDREKIQGLQIVKPTVTWVAAPLKPLQMPELEQSVLLGRSPFMAPGDGLGDIEPAYEPLEDGGFRIVGSTRRLNRPIAHGQNRVWTGDVPVFRIDTTTGNGSYASDKVFPLWPRPDIQAGSAYPSMGTLRLAVPGSDGNPQWLDTIPGVTTTFRPGYTEYEVSTGAGGWTAKIVVAPALDFHGMICHVQFDRPMPLHWQYGGMWWQESEANANRVELVGSSARITEPKLPGGLVVVGCDRPGEVRAAQVPFGQQVEFTSVSPQTSYHVCAAWGVTSYDHDYARTVMARLETQNPGLSAGRDRLQSLWFDCYIKPALEPESHCATLVAHPAEELQRTRSWWDKRRDEFQIRTPDRHLNALINWSRCTTEYHRQGPGLVLGGQYWIMYSHISTGWYGKEWGGDHQALDDCLRLYAAMQSDEGFIRWVSPSLTPFAAENNTPYWVDHVWWHYAWTGDLQFVRDLWPNVRKAVAWQCVQKDPDGDGLFQDWYEYWNCDSNGKGPKAAASSAMSWAMLDRAARLAAAVGDEKAEAEYRSLAERSRQAIFRELWREDAGRLGSIGGEGIWRGHPQTWEEYLGINAGLLSPDQGRRAMRWLTSHYGFEPKPGVHLLACSDWFPIRWSNQWVPTGDTLLAAMAGMRSGDTDHWWPYVETVVHSSFKSDFPGINMGISNSGAGGGDREDVDSVDPHVHSVVRGLFGVTPALQEDRLEICPALPSVWRDVSLRTPDVCYEYQRDGDRAVFRIRTPRPVVKSVRGNLTGAEVITPKETESVVTVTLGPSVPFAEPPTHPPTILAEQDPPTAADRGRGVQPAERSRLALFDLSEASNVTAEEMTGMQFVYDDQGGMDFPGVRSSRPTQPVDGWWGNPGLKMKPMPRVVETLSGAVFLTAGRPRPGLGLIPKDRLALSSWPPYPLPGGASIAVGMRCERVWLLLQSYVHPMKNYIPNGEVVFHYADGRQTIESLVPPFNLDCYFQHFSRKGTPVPLGVLGPAGFVHGGMMSPHADVLEIACDPAVPLASIEVRATCSEGVLGLVGLTALTP